MVLECLVISLIMATLFSLFCAFVVSIIWFFMSRLISKRFLNLEIKMNSSQFAFYISIPVMLTAFCLWFAIIYRDSDSILSFELKKQVMYNLDQIRKQVMSKRGELTDYNHIAIDKSKLFQTDPYIYSINGKTIFIEDSDDLLNILDNFYVNEKPIFIFAITKPELSYEEILLIDKNSRIYSIKPGPKPKQ
jgi:hypothetical protein